MLCVSLIYIVHLYPQLLPSGYQLEEPDRMEDTLVEFRAGKMQFVDRLLRADSRKGLIRLTQVSPHHAIELGSTDSGG